MIVYSVVVIVIFLLLHWLVRIDPEPTDRRELIVTHAILILALTYSLVILHRPDTPGPIHIVDAFLSQIPVLQDIVR